MAKDAALPIVCCMPELHRFERQLVVCSIDQMPVKCNCSPMIYHQQFKMYLANKWKSLLDAHACMFYMYVNYDI